MLIQTATPPRKPIKLKKPRLYNIIWFSRRYLGGNINILRDFLERVGFLDF
jgi:hypothetical protein